MLRIFIYPAEWSRWVFMQRVKVIVLPKGVAIASTAPFPADVVILWVSPWPCTSPGLEPRKGSSGQAGCS
jgi:hypothetical protein